MDLSLPTRKRQGLRPKVHLSSQDSDKQAGAYAYSVDTGDRHALQALDGRGADVTVEAMGKEHVLTPLGAGIG